MDPGLGKLELSWRGPSRAALGYRLGALALIVLGLAAAFVLDAAGWIAAPALFGLALYALLLAAFAPRPRGRLQVEDRGLTLRRCDGSGQSEERFIPWEALDQVSLWAAPWERSARVEMTLDGERLRRGELSEADWVEVLEMLCRRGLERA